MFCDLVCDVLLWFGYLFLSALGLIVLVDAILYCMLLFWVCWVDRFRMFVCLLMTCGCVWVRFVLGCYVWWSIFVFLLFCLFGCGWLLFLWFGVALLWLVVLDSMLVGCYVGFSCSGLLAFDLLL